MYIGLGIRLQEMQGRCFRGLGEGIVWGLLGWEGVLG